MAFPNCCAFEAEVVVAGELEDLFAALSGGSPNVKLHNVMEPDRQLNSRPACCFPVASCFPGTAGKTQNQLLRFPTSTSLASNPEDVTEKILSEVR
jgi:hypothetical protein